MSSLNKINRQNEVNAIGTNKLGYSTSGEITHHHKRINYIDAVRGFVMFIVVFQHVRAFGFNLSGDDGILSFIYLYFFLSTFFLVSGFVGHKVTKSDTLKSLLVFIRRRFYSLIVPTVVFLVIYDIIAFKNGMDLWGFPGGYWFTYSLFFITISLGGLCVLFNKFRIENGLKYAIFLGVLLESVRVLFPNYIDNGILYYLRTRQFCSYFLFYVIGVYLYIYKEKLFPVLAKDWVKGFIIGGTMFLLLIRYAFGDLLPNLICGCFDFLISISSSIAVFMLFYLSKDYWNQDICFSRWLKLIGKNSLEIYMLHYFFIPVIPSFGVHFKSANNAILELMVVGGVSIIVVCLCLVISKILKMAGPLGKMIFGK